MYALTHLALGLLVAHAIWALAFVTGTLLEDRRIEAPENAGAALVRVVIWSVAGLAIWGFEGFVFGLLGMFDTVGLVAAAALNAAAFVVVRRENPLTAAFWRPRIALLSSACSWPALTVYAGALVLSVPAVIPDFSSDGVRVHLAYAYEWFRAGRIYGEQRMRFPYYAFNVELLYTWMMVARVDRYVPFLTWLNGALAALGVCGLIATADGAAQRARTGWERIAAQSVYTLLPFSLMLAAVFLRWWPTAMTDVTVCALYLAVAGAIAAYYLQPHDAWLRAAVVTTAFLAGAKPSYLFFVPFVAAVLIVICRRARMRGSEMLALVGTLVVLTLPWYTYNLIRDGDPIPPVFNLALRGHDPNFTEREWDGIRGDVAPSRTLDDWELFPLREFFDPQTSEFREYGVTAVVLSLYAIVIVAPLALARARTPVERSRACILGFTLLGVVYLMATSALTRYTLLVYPLVAVSAGILLLEATSAFRKGLAAAPLLAALAVVPTPVAREFYHEFYGVYYAGLTQVIPSDDFALGRFVAGYAEARPLFEASTARDLHMKNVLLVEAPLGYYVELHDAQPFGDWSGPGRYADFVEAIDADSALAYLRAHDIGALVVSRRSGPLVPDELAFLGEQLRAGGFVEVATSDAQFAVFVPRSVEERAQQHDAQTPGVGG